MKTQKSFYITFLILNVIGISIFILLFVNNNTLSNSLKTVHKNNELMRSGIDSLQLAMNETSNEVNSALNENIKLKKAKSNYFPEFAKNYLNNVFDSQSFLIENSESKIVSTSIEGDSFVSPDKEYSSILSYKNKKSRITGNVIYLFETIYEYDEGGSDQGMQLHFKKNASGDWKLFKIIYEGC
ncbi:MAG: hypothetical protein IPM96_17390 [Ignavibacteria bacterium]|nr:hypothetical protein [Ignavibacteria bacterium]